jgi:glycosyltransferase involved in cell wall biosynthesis
MENDFDLTTTVPPEEIGIAATVGTSFTIQQEKKKPKYLVISPLEHPFKPDHDFANPVTQQSYWLAKHHEENADVTVVRSIASPPFFKDVIDVHSTNEREAWAEYKDLVKWEEYDLVIDFSFEKWSYVKAKEKKNLKVLYTLHPIFHGYSSPPPLKHPCLVGVSDPHCQQVSKDLGVVVKCLPFGYELPAEPPKREDKDYLLYFGRVVKEKGIHELIEICRRRRIDLVIAGDDRYVDQAYVHKILEQADGDLIRYMGSVNEPVKLKLIAEAHALVIPYLSDFDAFTVLTAKAATLLKVPTVTMNKGAVRETIELGDNGVYVDSLDQLRDFDFEHLEMGFTETMMKEVKPRCETFERLIGEAISSPW